MSIYRINIPFGIQRLTGSFVSLNCSGIEAFVWSAYFFVCECFVFQIPMFWEHNGTICGFH